MSNMDRLEQTLRALREADAERQAPIHVETRLRAVFREHHDRKRPSLFLRWSLAAAVACTAAGLIVWRLSSPTEVHSPPVPVAAEIERAPRPEPTAVRTTGPEQVHAAAPVPRRQPRQRQKQVVDFVALPFAPPMEEDDFGQVIRVRLPRQSIRSLGLPVNEDRLFDRVPADILMGQDGVARGIRLLRASDLR